MDSGDAGDELWRLNTKNKESRELISEVCCNSWNIIEDSPKDSQPSCAEREM